MKLRAALLGAAAACAMPVVAQAQEFVQGPYVGLSGGWSWTQDIELESRGFRNEIDFKDGITVLGEAGFRTSLGIRPALEVGWTRSTVGDIAGGAFGRAGGNGKVNALTVMGALYYDLNAIGPVRPYVGAGVGVADVKFKRVGDLFASGLSISERDRAVAWQVGAGVNAAVSENLDLTVGYRFLDTGIVRYNKVTDTVFDYQTHTVLVGLRYTFGAPAAAPRAAEPAAAPVAAPPPPPPPPPAPAISRNFTVFFDFDKSELTTDAQQVLRDVVRNAQQGNIVAIEVVGHADTSGDPAYNQRLSLRRAEAVREYLVGQGMGNAQVTVAGKGETDPLVPTADGVREPSNRRSVIIFPQRSPGS